MLCNDSDLQCWVPGGCEGTTVSVDVVSREEECLIRCQNADGCNWLTFDESDGACLLFAECLTLGQNDCDTCWSSQVQCRERQGKK